MAPISSGLITGLENVDICHRIHSAPSFRYSCQKKFLPLGVDRNQARPSRSARVGRMAAVHASLRCLIIAASSITTALYLRPLATSTSSSDQNSITPPLISSILRSLAFFFVMSGPRVSVACRHTSGRDLEWGANQATGWPARADRMMMSRPSVVLPHRLPHANTLNRLASLSTWRCALCGLGSLSLMVRFIIVNVLVHHVDNLRLSDVLGLLPLYPPAVFAL